MEPKNDAGEVEESLDLPAVAEGQEDTTDWKAEAQKLREKAIKQRERTKVLKEQLREFAPKKPEAKPEKKSDELDYGALAYLTTKGIETDEDIEFTKGELKKHGGTLQELLGNEYFKSQLKARKDSKAVLDATPTGTRMPAGTPPNEVEYHLEKYKASGKLPQDREMALKVVNARLTSEAKRNKFTDQPVVGA